MIQNLRKNCSDEIFDHTFLISHLKDYKAPYRKITTLLQSQSIIRIKKGLYAFGEQYRRAPIHKGTVANLIFGPSYVSEEYALSYHHLIPERVEMMTCVSTKRKKIYHTPLGTFRYHHINPRYFAIGIEQEPTQNSYFLIASPEKALADTVAKYPEITSEQQMKTLLVENLRIDLEMLAQINLKDLQEISDIYRKPVVQLLHRTILKGLS